MTHRLSGRGMLTDAIKQRSKELLGYEITQAQLRFMPYIIYCMMNEQKLEPVKISQGERDIWMQWKKEGHCDGGASGMTITREFWDILCSLCFMGYVAYADLENGTNN